MQGSGSQGDNVPREVIDTAFQRAVVGMAITDASGYDVEVNDALCSLLGYTSDELLAMSFRDITADADLDLSVRAMRDLGEGRSSEFRLEKRYITRAGSELWARSTGVAVHDASGALLRIIVQFEDLTLRRASEAMAVRRESLDELTEVANRKSFYERLDVALGRPRRSTRNLALLVVNIDRFHQINAGLGHPSGDAVLIEVASRLVGVVRGDDVVARLGGDEFAVLTLGMSAPLDAVALAVDIRQMLGRPYWCDGNPIFVSVRVGVVTNVEDSDAQTLVQMASAATHHAKRLSGGWALHTEGANTSSRDEFGLVSELRSAINDGALTVAYQPVVDHDGAVDHLEALARWHHPDRGPVPPDQFIVLAERNGLIDLLTIRVMTLAVRQVAEWNASGIDACVAVNLSGRLLTEPDLAARVAAVLRSAGVPATKLILEVTETAIAEGSNPAIWATLDALRSTGVRISIDDFGTGYSSLSYLKELPVDEMKIDRSFILDLDTDERTERIVRSIIDLAHTLDLTVVAEGVENAAVADRLRALGVDYLQGYGIARPAPARHMTEWLRQRSKAAGGSIRQSQSRGLDVLVVDSQPVERAALRRRLRDSKHRVAQAHSGGAALNRLKKKMPDVVILDHLMPGQSGIETAPQLRAAGYSGPILLLSGSAPDSTEAVRYPLDVWPVSHADEALLIRLVDGYAHTPAPPAGTVRSNAAADKSRPPTVPQRSVERPAVEGDSQ